MSAKSWTRGIWAVSVVVTASALWAAQQPTDNANQFGGQPGTVQRPGTLNRQGNMREGRMDLDHYLVKTLIKANREEIELAHLAEQRSANPDVKKFASQMAQEHTRFLNSLQQFQGNQQGTRETGQGRDQFQTNTPAAPGTTSQFGNQPAPGATSQFGNRAAPTDQNAPAQGRRPFVRNQEGRERHGAAHQFAQLMEDVAQQTHQSIMRELSQKEGAQFDRCYLQGQVFMHIWLSDALTAFERNASPRLQPVLQEGLQTTQQHLQHLRALLSRVEQGTKSTAQREDESLRK